MIPLNKIKFKELDDYLYSKNVFGLTASKRKHTIIYHFSRYYNKVELDLNVKVMKKTKYVISAEHKGTIYTDYDKLKELVDKLPPQKPYVKKR